MLIPLVVVAALTFVTAGVFAYGAAKRNNIVHNHLVLPTVKGEIEETFTPEEPIEIGGEAQTKEIVIKNTGDSSFFVRVMVFPEISTTAGNLLPANLGTEILVDLGSDWEDGEDGYFYYKGKVAKATETPALFTKVALADGLDSAYEGANFSMQVKSETVTASNHQYRKVWWNKAVDTAPTETAWKTVDDVLAPLITTP